MNKDLNLTAAVMHKKPRYKTCKKNKIFDNLLNQNFCVKEKNKVWWTDFTYMCQNNGRTRYNCTIIDLYDRSVIASVNAEHINTELAIAKLREALNAEKNAKGLILHSEQGVQYVRHHSYNKYSTPMEARFS